jgi:hypothetical protein
MSSAKDKNRLVKVNICQMLSGIAPESQRKESGNRVTDIYISGDVKDGNILAGDENEANASGLTSKPAHKKS